MTLNAKALLSILAACTLAFGSVSAVEARSGHGPHFGPGPGPHGHGPAPRWHGGPPPPHHHHSWHRGDWAWVWGPLAAGAVIYGASEYYRPRSTTYVIQQPTTPAPAMSSAPSAQKFVYWCEAEQGYYPQVRACPTGWKQMPAPN